MNMRQKKTRTWQTLGAMLVMLTLAACTGKEFRIKGEIAGAEGQTLYLYHMTVEKPVAIDSVTLTADGAFSFSQPATDAPDFYVLRLGEQNINVCIDSTETITVRAQADDMATGYTIEGSDDNLKIRELALMQIDLQQRAMEAERTAGEDRQALLQTLQAMVDDYKNTLKEKYIYPAPEKPYAYYALFQTLGGMLLFDPQTNEEDVKTFAAVGTGWDTYFPDSERGKNLHNITIEGMKNVKYMRARRENRIDLSTADQTGLLDIALPDGKGHVRRLSDLKGRVVLLDFHVFATRESAARIMQLRDVYNRYADRGFEIFQVSLDTDEHFWQTSTAALPWVSVRDEASLQSEVLRLYNVQDIPTFFLIDRQNNLVKRDAQIKDLDEEIKKLL